MEIACAFPFNIHCLFVYLFKVMSTTAAQVTTFVYLLMEIACRLHVVLCFNIYYIFVYFFKAMSTKTCGMTNCFYLLM